MSKTVEAIEPTHAPPTAQEKSTRNLVIVASLLAAVVFAVPPLAMRNYTDEDAGKDVTEQTVSADGITVPAAGGGDLVCESSTDFTDTVQRWKCDDTAITAKSGESTDDPDLALARYVRFVFLDREPDTGAVKELDNEVRVLKRGEGEDREIGVSIPQDKGAEYFTFANAGADELAQPLIDAAENNALGKESADER